MREDLWKAAAVRNISSIRLDLDSASLNGTDRRCHRRCHRQIDECPTDRRLGPPDFVAGRPGVAAVQGHGKLLIRAAVGAAYVATPTAAKEDIALAAIGAGKHVLIDKSFLNHASLLRMTKPAASKGVVIMDATHFVHHPRTAAITKTSSDLIGVPRSLHTAFYFPFPERTNIRFDVRMEPMGALGDMAWYSMRAVVEYLRPKGNVTTVTTVLQRDPERTALVRASGLIAFESGETSTFHVGYTAGTAIMDLQLLGTGGVIAMDDFVLDWPIVSRSRTQTSRPAAPTELESRRATT